MWKTKLSKSEPSYVNGIPSYTLLRCQLVDPNGRHMCIDLPSHEPKLCTFINDNGDLRNATGREALRIGYS